MTSTQKVAFITGGNRGIGLETARQLGRAGITVVLGARDTKKGEAAVEELRSEGVTAETIQFDATDPATFEKARDYFETKYGRLDILVNNAAVSLERVRGNTASSVAPEILRQTFETNFFAVVELTQKLLPLIKKAPAGRIVNLSSILGSLSLHADPGSPIAEVKTLAYGASKTALNAFTVYLADELRGTKVKVNSAHPGWVKTEMGGEEAPLDLEEGGKTSLQLATLDENGPSGGYFHMGETLPW